MRDAFRFNFNNAELVEFPSNYKLMDFPNRLPDTFFHIRQDDQVDILFREISHSSACACVDAFFLKANHFAVGLNIKPEAKAIFHRPVIFFFVIYMW